jgi:hypothetical protein
MSWARDPSTWVLVAGAVVRILAALQLDPAHGYDAAGHFLYADLLRAGHVPRVHSGVPSAQNPPLYYALALALGLVGLGRRGGQAVSIAAGIVRLVIADRLFRAMAADGRRGRDVRLCANLVHAFLPFALRIDVFYAPESLAATLAVTATAAAVAGSVGWAGVALGLALLPKASAVAAVPAVATALGSPRRATVATAIAVALLLPWAAPNLRAYGTPYPSGYVMDDDVVWNQPILARHPLAFYLPRLRVADLTWPYWGRPVSLPNAFFLEAWADYYNYLSPGPRPVPPPHAANSRALSGGMRATHVVLALVGLVLLAVLLVGVLDALRRAARWGMGREEVALAVLGAAYLTIAIAFAIVVPREEDGAVKATYALGAAPILSFWTGTGLACLSRGRAGRFAALALAAAPATVAVVQRVVFRGP